MKLNELLKQYRKENKLTQQNLADKLKIKRSTLSDIENGRIKGTLEFLSKLADTTNKPMSYWIGEEYEEIEMKKHEALDLLIDAMIEKEIIKNDGKIPENYHNIIIGLLEKEIALKLEKATK